MSYLLNLIRNAPIEFFYLEIDSDEIKKTTNTEYKNILNKEMVRTFNFFNMTFDFDFDIEFFPNIESLYFESVVFKSLSSYSFISKCKNLNKLEFKNCIIKFIAPIINASNINLKILKINSVENIDDIDIGQLITLEQLEIINSRLTYIGDLEKLYKLKTLNLQNNCLVKLNGIENLKDLISLNISNNCLISIDEIGNFKNLEEIVINNNQITKLWDLTETPKIKKIIAYSNNLSNINDFVKLKNLEIFEINLNPINSLPNLLLMYNLDYDKIKIDWSKINYVEGMKGFGLIKNIIKNLTLNI
jgi:Leucine-rich repeat (LRR) protein